MSTVDTPRIRDIATRLQYEDFILDFDFAMTDNLITSKLKNYIVLSHDSTKQLFEGIVSERYKTYMRGEVVE